MADPVPATAARLTVMQAHSAADCPPWVCPLCQDKGMVLVTFADGAQEIVPCSAQCVRKADLDAD